MKANIPPFQIGDKVVYIKRISLPYNSIHIVLGFKQHSCGCWALDIGKKNSSDYTFHHCRYHGPITKLPKNNSEWFQADAFRKVQEQTAPLLTFEKIKETEKEEILIMN